jgi:hypothetical protein
MHYYIHSLAHKAKKINVTVSVLNCGFGICKHSKCYATFRGNFCRRGTMAAKCLQNKRLFRAHVIRVTTHRNAFNIYCNIIVCRPFNNIKVRTFMIKPTCLWKLLAFSTHFSLEGSFFHWFLYYLAPWLISCSHLSAFRFHTVTSNLQERTANNKS